MARWGRGFSGGFSLVDLLLVIAIIVLLLAILMPVIFTSKSQANAAKCASNLSQLGKAFHLYLSDWNGVYPSPGGRIGDYNCWSQSGNGGLVKYVGSKGGVGTVWCCPELKRWEGKYAGRTYSMNSYLRGIGERGSSWCDQENKFLQKSIKPWHLYGCPENIIEKPQRTVLLYEGLPVTPSWPDADDYIYRCGNWSCVRGWFEEKNPRVHTINSWLPWHGRKNNYLYCDGHVRRLVPDKYPKDPPFDTTNEWWVRKSVQAAKYWH